jgi:hypothetical protein
MSCYFFFVRNNFIEKRKASLNKQAVYTRCSKRAGNPSHQTRKPTSPQAQNPQNIKAQKPPKAL